MKYFLDTEFIEGTQKRSFLGFSLHPTKPTIDLISIAIVAEDGREYYAISKDFNLKEAWNRLNKTTGFDEKPYYWIRENVLKPIYNSLKSQRGSFEKSYYWHLGEPFSYDSLKYLLERFGKTNQQIAKEIQHFTHGVYPKSKDGIGKGLIRDRNPVFYGYYCAYDWVVFCQLFGIMMDLPEEYPWYCKDLKQIADSLYYEKGIDTAFLKPGTQHDALNDARWNRDFYNFLQTRQNGLHTRV